MAFPRLNMSSYWLYLVGGMVMIASFFSPQGAPNSGWRSYPPLADFATMGQTFWLAGMCLLILSSLLGSINTIATIVQLRAPGLTWFRLPFFIWAQLVTAFLLPSPGGRCSLHMSSCASDVARIRKPRTKGYRAAGRA